MGTTVSNGPFSSNDDYTVRRTVLLNELIQHVVVVRTDGTEVDWDAVESGSGGGGSGGSLGDTATPAQTSCNNNASTVALAANANRLPGTWIVNPNQNVTFWVTEGAAAVVGQGSPLFYAGTYEVRTKAQVNVIQASGSSKSINTLEVT